MRCVLTMEHIGSQNFALTILQALRTSSATGSHKSTRTLTNVLVQHQLPRGEGGGIEWEKREYRDVAHSTKKKTKDDRTVNAKNGVSTIS